MQYRGRFRIKDTIDHIGLFVWRSEGHLNLHQKFLFLTKKIKLKFVAIAYFCELMKPLT